jgi:hypothetical protein
MDEHHSADEHDLGELVDVYRASSLKQLLRLIVGAAFIGAGVLMLRDPSAFERWDILFPAVVCLVVGAGGVLWAFSVTRLRVLLYERGFVYREGRRARTFRWDEIEAVDLTETAHQDRQGNILYYTHSFRIRTPDGREAVLNDTQIGDGETCGRTIMREVRHCKLMALLKVALRLEAAGKNVEASDAFEQLLRESPYNELADQAREHLQRLRQSAPPVSKS